jgi:hypothetical protein
MATIDKRPLKAYVRFDGTGRIVPSSLILRRKKPKVGKWVEIPAYECCNPTVSPTTTVNSQSLTFPITYTSLRTRCDGINVGDPVYTTETVNNIGELVTLFNNTPGTQLLGTYSALGEDVLVLTVTDTIKNTLCPTGVLSLYVFTD